MKPHDPRDRIRVRALLRDKVAELEDATAHERGRVPFVQRHKQVRPAGGRRFSRKLPFPRSTPNPR